MKLTKTDLIELLPLGILTIIAIYSMIEVAITDYLFGIEQYVGLTLLGVSVILFFVNRRIYKYIFGLTLLIALGSLIAFTKSIVCLHIMGLPVQLLILPIICLFTWIHKEELEPKLKELRGKSNKNLISNSNSKIDNFRKKFRSLSNKEIEMKLSENLVPEALEALKQIQNERKEV